MKKTNFYYILKEARNDDSKLLNVINQIMPLINKYSVNEELDIDEDLKSELIEYSIKLIKTGNLAEKLNH